MRILLDIDGLLADWMGAVTQIVEEGTGRVLTPKDVNGWLSLSKLGFSRTEQDYIESVLASRGFCTGLEVLPGAKEGVTALAKMGEIAYVTSIWWGSETWTYERHTWLKKHGFLAEGQKLVFTKNKELVTGDVFVDDKPENVMAWRAQHPGKLGLLWSTPWNLVLENSLPRVAGWMQLIEEVLKWNASSRK